MILTILLLTKYRHLTREVKLWWMLSWTTSSETVPEISVVAGYLAGKELVIVAAELLIQSFPIVSDLRRYTTPAWTLPGWMCSKVGNTPSLGLHALPNNTRFVVSFVSNIESRFLSSSSEYHRTRIGAVPIQIIPQIIPPRM